MKKELKNIQTFERLIKKLKTLCLYFVMCSIKRKKCKSKMEEIYQNRPAHILIEY